MFLLSLERLLRCAPSSSLAHPPPPSTAAPPHPLPPVPRPHVLSLVVPQGLCWSRARSALIWAFDMTGSLQPFSVLSCLSWPTSTSPPSPCSVSFTENAAFLNYPICIFLAYGLCCHRRHRSSTNLSLHSFSMSQTRIQRGEKAVGKIGFQITTVIEHLATLNAEAHFFSNRN